VLHIYGVILVITLDLPVLRIREELVPCFPLVMLVYSKHSNAKIVTERVLFDSKYTEFPPVSKNLVRLYRIFTFSLRHVAAICAFEGNSPVKKSF
jgi:hypothetical protein